MANRVFEDRLGLLVIDAGRGVSRLAAIRNCPYLTLRDVFMPETSTPTDIAAVRQAGLYAHLWIAGNGVNPPVLVSRVLSLVDTLKPGALELNLELPNDPPLKQYVRDVVVRVRAKWKNLRMRINLGAWKAFAAPVDLLASDPNLYVCEGTYLGDMAPVSPADVLDDLLSWGVPKAKATLCYGAAGPVPPQDVRVCTVPDLSRRNRGVVFSDDLLADVGLL